MSPDLLNRHDIDYLYTRFGSFGISYFVVYEGGKFYRVSGSHHGEVVG